MADGEAGGHGMASPGHLLARHRVITKSEGDVVPISELTGCCKSEVTDIWHSMILQCVTINERIHRSLNYKSCN